MMMPLLAFPRKSTRNIQIEWHADIPHYKQENAANCEGIYRGPPALPIYKWKRIGCIELYSQIIGFRGTSNFVGQAGNHAVSVKQCVRDACQDCSFCFYQNTSIMTGDAWPTNLHDPRKPMSRIYF